MDDLVNRWRWGVSFAALSLALTALAGACAGDGAEPTPVPTPTAPATRAPSPTATPGAVASPTPRPATPTSTPQPTATPAGISRVKISLVALDDNGRSGKKIGCNDSVVAVERQIAPTTAPLRAALEELLSIRDRNYGQSGLYNSLYQSNLRVERVSIDDGKATINLSGSYRLGGVCDIPRFEAQIVETALQFATVKEVSVFLNGVPLERALSQR